MNRLLIFALFFILSGSPLKAEGTYFSDIIVNRVIDGDTVVVTISELPDVFGKNISVRLAGIDTPELRGKCHNEKQLAIKARDRLAGLFMKSESTTLSNVERGKYFRLVATVRIDGVDASSVLLKEGLAKIYSGGVKPDWCAYRKSSRN